MSGRRDAARRRLFVVRSGSAATSGPDDIADRAPRTVTPAQWGADVLDVSALGAAQGWRGRLPAPLAIALEVRRRCRDHEAIVSYGEATAFPTALGLLGLRRRPRHVAALLWPLDAPGASAPKRLVKRHLYPVLARRAIDAAWIPSPRQQELVAAQWRYPRARMVAVGWGIDTDFWRPLEREQDGLCSVGREMRDFETLLEALEGTGLRCHVAAGTGPASAAYATDDVRAARGDERPLPVGVTLGPLTMAELRERYAQSRLVVVPLLPTDSDNGITTVLEAMAMGIPVVATATAGRAAILVDDVTCVLVAPGDALALRRAIETLHEDAPRRRRLAAAARARVLEAHRLEHWLAAMLAAADR